MVVDRGINRYYFEFWRDVFCDGKQVEMKREILQNLKCGARARLAFRLNSCEKADAFLVLRRP